MNKPLVTLFLSSLIVLLTNCTPRGPEPPGNPPAPGFNLSGSDPQAVALADQVMEASGGRKNWDQTRYLSWVFVGRRKHFWDKMKGDIRIESFADSTTYLLNINTMKGRVQKAGQEVKDPALLDSLLTRGKSLWINDAYWLVMPFKMKDDGVTLQYIGQEPTADGRPADLVAISFQAVGDTPDNKYHVAIDQETKLVSEWTFFREATQDSADFIMPWRDYQKYGNLMLSGDRDKLQLTEISVPEQLPDSIFTTF